jgi:hypothetical protein
MALPLIAAGVAARAVAKKVAKEVAKKSAKKTAKKSTEVKRLNPSGKTIKQIRQRAEANRIAKDSVKVRPANKSNPTNKRLNLSEDVRLERMKSGDLAKGQARLEEKRNQITNQFFGKSPTVKINSSVKSTKAVKKTSPKKK